MEELYYSTQEILNQQFKTKMRGYDPEEVDEFLDNIIRDYEAMQKEILTLQEDNERLEAQVDKFAQGRQVEQKLAAQPQVAQPKSAAVTNFDILKRLSNLEREVFGKKLGQQATPVVEQPQAPKTFEEPAIDPQATRLF